MRSLSHKIVACLLLWSAQLLCWASQAEIKKPHGCAALLHGAQVLERLGAGDGGAVFLVITPLGEKAVAKFYFKDSDTMHLLKLTHKGLEDAILVQKELAKHALAPDFYGSTGDPHLIAALVEQLPIQYQKEKFELVTLSQLIEHPVIKMAGSHESYRRARSIFRELGMSVRESVERQVKLAETILKDLRIYPLDDQALITLSNGDARLWLIDFDLYGHGDAPILREIREAILDY